MLYVLLLINISVGVVYNIDAFGAIRNNDSHFGATTNSNALKNALNAANRKGGGTVLVPAGNTYYIFHVQVTMLANVELKIAGSLIASDDIASWLWPARPNPGGDFNYGVLQFDDATNFTIDGGGVIDGQGYKWWVETVENGNDERPHLIFMDRGTNIVVRDVKLRNSPMFHLKISDVVNLYIGRVDVFVDVFEQKKVGKCRFGFYQYTVSC
jgi:polygalacturonase